MFLDFLINNAFAQEAAAAAAKQPSTWASLLPLFLIMVVFYFFIIRPQQKKIKDHQNMLKEIQKGDKVVTAGGIFGSVAKIIEAENAAMIEIADNVLVKVRLEMITDVVNPPAMAATKN